MLAGPLSCLECFVQFRVHMDTLEREQGRIMKLITGLEPSLIEGEVEKAGSSQPEKAQGGPHPYVYKYPKKGFTGDGVKFFSVMLSDGTRGNEQKLKRKKFYLNTRKTCSTVSVVKHCSRLPREVNGRNSLHPWRHSASTGHDPEQSVLADLL